MHRKVPIKPHRRGYRHDSPALADRAVCIPSLAVQVAGDLL